MPAPDLEAIGGRGRDYVLESQTWESEADRLLAVYEELAASR